MARRPPPPAVLGGSPDDIEAQFYEAMRLGDIDALMALWADDEEIVCVHPGGARLIGAAAIRSGFTALFRSGGIPVQTDQVHRLVHLGSALHHLVELIEVATESGLQRVSVLATNFYIKTPQGWRLASHHASPGSAQPLAEPGDTVPARLH